MTKQEIAVVELCIEVLDSTLGNMPAKRADELVSKVKNTLELLTENGGKT